MPILVIDKAEDSARYKFYLLTIVRPRSGDSVASSKSKPVLAENRQISWGMSPLGVRNSPFLHNPRMRLGHIKDNVGRKSEKYNRASYNGICETAGRNQTGRLGGRGGDSGEIGLGFRRTTTKWHHRAACAKPPTTSEQGEEREERAAMGSREEMEDREERGEKESMEERGSMEAQKEGGEME